MFEGKCMPINDALYGLYSQHRKQLATHRSEIKMIRKMEDEDGTLAR
jgi:hypothetical protein